ncbi:HCP-like protein [Panus rudis PR-1116 ss-1]|nr:HCP-like protein [Panus rudis PR-1116 ss-1]
MVRSLDEHAAGPPSLAPPAFPMAMPSRGPSPLPPPQGSDWSPWAGLPPPPPPPPPPPRQESGPYQPSFPQHDNVTSSFASLSLGPQHSSPPPIVSYSPPRHAASPPHHARVPSGPQRYPMAPGVPAAPPSLTAPLPTIPSLTAALSSIQQPNYDPARKIAWAKDVLSLVTRAHQQQQTNSADAPNVNSTDIPAGPVRITDPQLQRLVDVALQIVLQHATLQAPNPVPIHVAEAIYLKAMCEASGAYTPTIPHNPRDAFRGFEKAAKSGYHAAWFKLGRDYEMFGDVQHARDCFERGVKHGVESCLYRMGMAHLMGQLGLPPSPETALPLLQRAATLASVDVPQPAYVYGLLLLSEFSHIHLPPHLFTPLIPPGSTPHQEARKHLERAAYLNFSPAQYKLGHSYEYATPPFPFDALLSVQYYSLASQQGEVEADMALSKWFLCGAEGAFEKDEALAWTFAEKAARKGLPSAEFAMGYYAEVGVGGPKDLDSARKWYTRAAEHGNTDAADRLQAISQPAPQTLSRQEHESLTDTTLVRRRTQAKQRSDSRSYPPQAPPPIPGATVIENVRRSSLMGPVGVAPASSSFGAPPPQQGYGPPPPQGYGGAYTSSPPNQNARLPPVSEYPPHPSQPHSHSPHPSQTFPSHPTRGSSIPPPLSVAPLHVGPRPPKQDPQQQQQFQGAQRYTLVDPGTPAASPGPGPQASQQGGQYGAPGTPGAPGFGGPGGQGGGMGGPGTPGGAPGTPGAKPQKRPQTFAEMGIASTRAEDKDCVIM